MIKSRLHKLYKNVDDLIRPKKTLYFLHIPKSGGTSLVHFLRNSFQPHHWLNDGCYSIKHFLNLTREDFIQNHCFRGHFGMLFFNQFDRPLDHFVTILRDPIEQFCSNVHFQKQRFEQGLFEPWKRTEWVRIFDHPDYFNRFVNFRISSKNLSPILHNVGFKISHEIFTIKDYRKEVRRIQQEADYDILFNEAKSNLSKMTTIMFLEDIERSTTRLCKDLNIPHPMTFPILNKGFLHPKNTTYKERLNKENLERIEEYLKYDIKLYQYAKELDNSVK